MRTFPSLYIVASLYKVAGILLLVGVVLAGAFSGDVQDFVFSIILGGLAALTVYAIGDAILMFLDWHKQQAVSTEAMIRLLKTVSDRPTIKPLKHARKS